MTNEVKIEAVELEPCPICGNQPRWRGSTTDYRVGIFRLQCMGETHLFQAYGATEKICVAAWNARAPIATAGMVPRVVPEDVARLVERFIDSTPPQRGKRIKAVAALISLASTVADLERQLAEAREACAKYEAERSAYDKAIRLGYETGYLQGKTDEGKKTFHPGGLLQTVGSEIPPGCHCGEVCAAPVVMGRQMPCRRAQLAKGAT